MHSFEQAVASRASHMSSFEPRGAEDSPLRYLACLARRARAASTRLVNTPTTDVKMVVDPYGPLPLRKEHDDRPKLESPAGTVQALFVDLERP
ncbi:unnamed protein product [Phytophthora lilii]|uniref:Unnamed protein product n=1 Tax=Phytophthora lilii TaxID=2077276 RepID=A0A9W6U6G1_9STRA|nr:unnamed protein product [Phytophthora lilii]